MILIHPWSLLSDSNQRPRDYKSRALANWAKEAGIKILIPNGEFYASKVCDTFEEAVDLDVEALEKQLVKYKEKQRSK